MNASPSLLIFGGPYSNLQATRAVLAEAARRGIPRHRVICTGDVVAYGADPKACVDLLRESDINVVMGNCEQQLAAGADDCGCGFAPGGECDRLSNAWFGHARSALDVADRQWMGGLPRRLDITVSGLRLAVVHGSPSAINRFVFGSTPSRIKAAELTLAGVDGIIGGHCGLPFTQVIDGRIWHNPGVIGLPANDGTPRVWYSVISSGGAPRSISIEHACLNYDHLSAASSMRRAGLPENYASALSSGLWPNCDVLPQAEAKAQGRPLSPCTLNWDGGSVGEGPAWPVSSEPARIDPAKFRDPQTTAKGERRASVALQQLTTLWINTGTLCNLACTNCYIESTPKNDRLAFISAAEVAAYLDEIRRDRWPTRVIGFTGGEPFMNPELPLMLEDALGRGFEALVLTNAMKPMRRHERALLRLKERFGDRLTLRVSIDHYTRELHELERGPRSWQPTIDGLSWLADRGLQAQRRRPALFRRTRKHGARGIRRATRRVRHRRLRSRRARDLPGNERTRRRAGNHRRLLEPSGQVARRRDVRVVPHGGEAQGRRRPGGSGLHAAGLRRSIRARPDARRRVAGRIAQSSPLREILRTRRRRLQREVKPR